MSRPVWTGSLDFGPLHFPVRLHAAVSSKRLHFHLLHDADGARIQQKRVCSADGEEVSYEHVVKGYEVSPGRYVPLSHGELEALEPQARDSIHLEDFVALSEVEPLLLDTSYHVMPGEGAWRPLASLALALRASGRVGIGSLVLQQKGHLCVVRPHARGLVLSTLHYADELVPQDSFPEFSPRLPDEDEVESVLRLVQAHSTSFEPLRYHDLHRERLLAFIARRARSRGVLPAAPPASERRPPSSVEVPSVPSRASREARGEVRVRQEAARSVREGVPLKRTGRKSSSRKKGDSGGRGGR